MTLSAVNALTDEQRLIKTAELCGWTDIRIQPHEEPGPCRTDSTMEWKGKRPGMNWKNLKGEPVEVGPERIPPYLYSLDAMAEAETCLVGTDIPEYSGALLMVVSAARKPLHDVAPGSFGHVCASARDRNTAFLITMLP